MVNKIQQKTVKIILFYTIIQTKQNKTNKYKIHSQNITYIKFTLLVGI